MNEDEFGSFTLTSFPLGVIFQRLTKDSKVSTIVFPTDLDMKLISVVFNAKLC